VVVLGGRIGRRVGQVGGKLQEVREARGRAIGKLNVDLEALPNRQLHRLVGQDDLAVLARGGVAESVSTASKRLQLAAN
jgi:hypothetical protein